MFSIKYLQQTLHPKRDSAEDDIYVWDFAIYELLQYNRT